MSKDRIAGGPRTAPVTLVRATIEIALPARAWDAYTLDQLEQATNSAVEMLEPTLEAVERSIIAKMGKLGHEVIVNADV